MNGSARAGSMRWSLPPRLTPPVGSEAISPSRPVAPPAPDSRGSVPSCWKEPLLGMCAGHCNATSEQPALTERKREDADNSPWFGQPPVPPRIPLPGGCGAGRRQRRAPPAAVPPAVLKWVLFPALHQPPGFGIRELKPTLSTVPPPG